MSNMSNKDITLAELSKLTAEFENQMKDSATEYSPDEEEELFADFLAQYESGITNPIINNN